MKLRGTSGRLFRRIGAPNGGKVSRSQDHLGDLNHLAIGAPSERLESAEGLRFVEITTDPDNVPSQRVIERNGGVLVDEFLTVPALGGTLKRRYRVYGSSRG